MLKRMLRPAAFIGALAIGVTGGAIVALSPASAVVVGPATLSVSTGTADTLMTVDSSGPCAAPATKVKVRMDGFGLPATGKSVYAPQVVGFSTSEPMRLQLSASFFTYAIAEGTPLVGKYELTVQCVNSLGVTVYDEYAAPSMYWSTPGNSVANVASATFSTTAPAVNQVLPAITGSNLVGGALTCTDGTWTGATSFTRTWLRDGVVVPGATGTSRATVPADFGKGISCRVSASNGTSAVTADSLATLIGPGLGAFTGTLPSIAGVVKVGYTASASRGTWAPAPTTYAYQWLRGGAPIGGATKAAYFLTAIDSGKAISVRVTATAAGVATATRTSAAKAVAPGTIVAKKAPTISGKAKVGKKLTAGKGLWSPTPSTYSYQWLRSGKAIKGATKSTYKLTKKDKRKKVSVKVTVKKAGYTTVSKTSSSRKVS